MTRTLDPLTPTPATGAAPLESLVGHTPLLALRRVTAHLPARVRVFAKAEWANPGGSVKDRAALNILRAAEADGRLTPGKIVLDSTSGNTGIALAMFGAARGYRVKLFLPANASPERIAILRAYGADLALTDPLEGSDGALLAARDLAARAPERHFYADQYNNPANWQAHYHGTGAELWAQTGGRVTHFAAALGTTGTFTGTVRRLKDENPDVRAAAILPDSPFHGLEGMKHIPSAIRPGIYDESLADETLSVSTEAAYDLVLRLAREEGLLVGISSGAALAGALRVAEAAADSRDPAVIVTVFPDGGAKYLSGPPYRNA